MTRRSSYCDTACSVSLGIIALFTSDSVIDLMALYKCFTYLFTYLVIGIATILCCYVTTLLLLQLFYSSLDFVWDYPGKSVPER